MDRRVATLTAPTPKGVSSSELDNKMIKRIYHAYVDCDNISGYQVSPKRTYCDYVRFEIELPDTLNLQKLLLAGAFNDEARRRVVEFAETQFAPLLEHMPAEKLNWHWTRDIHVFTLTCRLNLPTVDSPNLVYELFCISLVEDAEKVQLFEDIPEHVKREHNLEPSASNISRRGGQWTGRIKIAPDFDETPDDFSQVVE